MRPGQNKRMRNNNRPTNNRRGPNPLTRSYESNGPDVKIRGNAHHVAEKYLQLARDAHTGGDPVAAENYLQHAEHYFRLIASAQAAQALAQSGQPRQAGDVGGDDLDDEEDFGGMVRPVRLAFGAGGRFLSTAAAWASGATQRRAERPAALHRAAAVRSRSPRSKGPGRILKPTGPARQSLSRPWFAARPSVRGAAGRLPRQSTGPRWTPTRIPAVSRRVATAGARRDCRGRRADKSSIVHNGRVKTGRRRNSRNSAHARRGRDDDAGRPDESDLATHEPTSAEGRFPGRGRRRRLRSPYGFNGSAAADSDTESPDPAIGDEPPVAE